MSHALSFCDFIAGWTGGMMGLIVGHPLDTIKVRQQILPGGGKILAIAKSTYKMEGVFGFFKGLSYPLLGSGIYNALFFGVYGNCLRILQGMTADSNVRKMCCEGEPANSTWHRDVFVAGCLGGTAAVIYSCPLEVIKIKLQSQTAAPTTKVSVCKKTCKTEPVYRGPYDAMIKIYKNYGIYGGLYRGTWSMFWRDVPTFGLYMLTYEHVLCWFKKKEDRSPHTSIMSQVVAGGIAGTVDMFSGVISWVTVAPLDVVKSRIQSDDFGRPIYNGMIDCFKKTVYQDGYKALFLGIILATVRSFPVNATTFVGYEFTIKFCEKCGYCKEQKSEKRYKRKKKEKDG